MIKRISLTKFQVFLLILSALFLVLILGRRILAGFETPDAHYRVTTRANTGAVTVEKLDLNSADEAALETLPGIGSTLARRITDYRTQIGSFTQVEQLLEVKGIGRETLENIRQYIEIREAQP